MNHEVKRIFGTILNVVCATLAGSSISLALMHNLPWLFIFTAVFLSLMLLGIFMVRSAEKERRLEYVEKYRGILSHYATHPEQLPKNQ